MIRVWSPSIFYAVADPKRRFFVPPKSSQFSVVHITPTEKIRYPSIDVSKLWYEFADEIKRDIVYDPIDA